MVILKVYFKESWKPETFKEVEKSVVEDPNKIVENYVIVENNIIAELIINWDN